MNSPEKNDGTTTSPARISSSSDRSSSIPGLSGGLTARSATKTRKKSATKTKKTKKPIKAKTIIKKTRTIKKTKKPKKAKTIIKKTRKKSGSKRVAPVVRKVSKVKSKKMKTTTKKAKSTRKSITAQETIRKSAVKTKTVKPKKTTKKKLKEAPDHEGKRRRARLYSVRSRLSSYQLGDDVIFKKVRDWNDHSKTVEMRGTVIALGSDPNISVNYIEVQFEIKNHPGRVTMQVRRFTVK